MKKLCCLVLISGFVGACSQLSNQLTDSTGTSLEQRCHDYRAVLPLLELRQEQMPQSWRADLIDAYRLFLIASCSGS